MAEINVDQNYFQHIKTKRLVARLGFGAESIPLKLWCYAASHAPMDGVLKGFTADEIKMLCEWPSNALSMLEALLDLNFLYKIKGGFKINEWEKHQGHIISYKIRAIKGAEGRWKKIENLYTNHASSIASEQLSIASSNALTKLTKKTNLKKNNSFKKEKSFFKPSTEEIKEYCNERNNGINAERFFDYYEARGWMIGKNKMKNWKAAVRTWEKNQNNSSPKLMEGF